MKLFDVFSSFDEFESVLSHYKDKNYVDYYIKDCKTLASINAKFPNGKMVTASTKIKYYYIKYCCVHGGCHKKKKNTLDQRVTSTMRQGCEAFIYLKASANGQQLEITKMDETHNHETSKILYSHLPNQRKITPENKAIVIELMDMKANKKLIQEKIMKESGKIVTLKDLSNIRTTAGNHCSKNDLTEVVTKLKSKFNCTVEVSIDEYNNLNGIFIQDMIMVESFSSFPEVVFADATYKLLDLRLPVYVLMTEDGNGQSEIAAIGLLVNEEESTLRWFFETFKKNNPISIQTRVYVTDKDMKERNVIRQVFPNSSLTICLFHTLRTFNREITCEKRNITPKERDDVKLIFQELTYCKSEEEYDMIYSRLQSIAPESIINYYNKNWHNIRKEWVMGMTFNTGNFMNKTNN
ncbi:unnamed protein product [Macrosiphum euphorbiae]|uniref:MULE transposase domain-containing protein n=1 Tax=Macrosiphum euphorbiae TaxID=13131 RepID=A0AAV0WRI7_9HEMI|nr:unnamed protein product [Macrosiphum euphorbiae]